MELIAHKDQWSCTQAN